MRYGQLPANSRTLAVAAWGLLGLFTALLVNKALYAPLILDDALLASVAKNWVRGYGFSTSYGQMHPFDQEITTGPGLLGVIALGIRWFGNTLWVPRVFPLILNLGLWFTILCLLRRHVPRNEWHWTMLLVSLAFLIVRPFGWVTPLGDLTAALYAMLACLLAWEGLQCGQTRRLLLAGMLSGLAILTKTIAAVPVVGLCAAMGAWALVTGGAWRFKGLASMVFLTGVVLLVLPWQLYEHAVLAAQDPDYQLYQRVGSTHAFLYTGSGLGGLIDAWHSRALLAHFANVTQTNLGFYAGEFQPLLGLGRPILFIILAGVAALLAWSLAGCRKQTQSLFLFLVLPAAVYLLWAVCIRQWLWGRHLYTGLFIALLPLGMVVAKRPWPSVLLLWFFALIIAIPLPDGYWGYRYRLMALPNDIDGPLQQFVDYLETHHRDEPIVGCNIDMPREVEYALQEVGRIGDCQQMLGTVLDMDDRAFLARYPEIFGASPNMGRISAMSAFVYSKMVFSGQDFFAPVRWKGTTGFLIVDFPMSQWADSYSTQVNFRAIRDFCRETLYDNGLYALHRCTQAELEQAVAGKGIGFAPPQWKLEVWRAQGR